MHLFAPRAVRMRCKLNRQLEQKRDRLKYLDKEIENIRLCDPSVTIRHSSLEDVGVEPSALCQTYRQYLSERAVLKVELRKLECNVQAEQQTTVAQPV